MTEPTMKEKRELIKNTYLAHTHSDEGGRFQKVAPNNVIGSSSISYPRIPSGPWSADYAQVPPEEPLGIDVTETPIVGESFEVEASLNQDFGWRKTIRDGVPQAADSLISASPEPTPDSEVARASNLTKEPARQPLPLSEKEGGVRKRDPEGAPPSRSKLIRRLR